MFFRDRSEALASDWIWAASKEEMAVINFCALSADKLLNACIKVWICLGLSVAKDFSTLAGVFANADCKDVNWLRDKLFSTVLKALNSFWVSALDKLEFCKVVTIAWDVDFIDVVVLFIRGVGIVNAPPTCGKEPDGIAFKIACWLAWDTLGVVAEVTKGVNVAVRVAGKSWGFAFVET